MLTTTESGLDSSRKWQHDCEISSCMARHVLIGFVVMYLRFHVADQHRRRHGGALRRVGAQPAGERADQA